MDRNISLVVLIVLFAFLIYQIFRLVYNRYFRNYTKEINAFLIEKEMEFVEKWKPLDSEWEKSPFEKPANFKLSFVRLRVTGVNIEESRDDYMIIRAKKGEDLIEFWLEINTTILRKPQLTIRRSRNIRKNKKLAVKKQNGILNVFDKCPACGFEVNHEDNECPDCGLNFI